MQVKKDSYLKRQKDRISTFSGLFVKFMPSDCDKKVSIFFKCLAYFVKYIIKFIKKRCDLALSQKANKQTFKLDYALNFKARLRFSFFRYYDTQSQKTFRFFMQDYKRVRTAIKLLENEPYLSLKNKPSYKAQYFRHKHLKTNKFIEIFKQESGQK